MAKWFKHKEFDCKCGCGLNNMNPESIAVLDTIRESAGIPFIVASGSRCPKHNQEVGGLLTSSHLTGYAADIQAFSSDDRFRIISSALSHGIKRIGIGKTFIHLDNDPSKISSVIWMY